MKKSSKTLSIISLILNIILSLLAAIFMFVNCLKSANETYIGSIWGGVMFIEFPLQLIFGLPASLLSNILLFVNIFVNNKVLKIISMILLSLSIIILAILKLTIIQMIIYVLLIIIISTLLIIDIMNNKEKM